MPMCHESLDGCGILSHEAGAETFLRRARRSVRAIGLGPVLLLAALSAPMGCAGDSNSGTGGGSGGTGGATGTGGTGGVGGGGSVDSSTDCALRTDVDTYVANMMKPGKNKIMSFQLIESKPGPPIKGDNDWKVKVTDAGGMPVSQGLRVRVWMPGHGHDALVSPEISYDAMTSTFGLKPVSLKIMGGVWRITLTVTPPDDPQVAIDIADFDFCIR